MAKIIDIRYLLSQAYSKHSLKQIIGSLCDVTQAIYDAKVQLKTWEVHIESIIIRHIYTSKSIFDLSQGSKLESIKTNHIEQILDYSSIYVLTRSLLESFLTLEYLYFNDLEEDEQLFRFRLWKIAGLKSRQFYRPRIDQSLQKKQTEELKTIEELRNEISSSPYFNELKKTQIWKLDKYGLPRIFSWHDLIKTSCVKEDFFADMYGLFSNYAHMEYLSAIQINESSQSLYDADNLDRVDLALRLVIMLNAVTITELMNRVKAAEIIYNALPQNITLDIERWNSIGRG